MKTKSLFMEDAYLTEMEADILDVQAEGPQQWRVVLSETVFYPMGGGQSTDQGLLKNEQWQGEVYQVRIKEGEIVHYVKGEEPPLQAKVKGYIKWERRYQHMRSHSAGHVIDFALYQLGHSPVHLKPLKADHGKKPYIVYEGVLKEDFREKLEQQANALVQQNLSFSTCMMSYEELEKQTLYLQPGLPLHKPLRMLTLESVGSVADGGTQVRQTSEVGKITLTKIEAKEGQTFIYYQIS